MKPSVSFFLLSLGIVSLLSLLLLISPWSLSTQTSSFSLALDLDDADGDQAVSSLDVSPDQVVPIQIFGSDIQGASRLSVRIEYDSTQVVYEGFDAGGVLPDAQVVVEQDSISVRVGIASLSGSVVNAGLIGVVRFRTTDAFLETEVRLVGAELGRGEQSDAVSLSLSVALQVAAPPSPDFDGSGLVNFADFMLFAGAFGYGEGDAKYGGKYDLNSDGGVGFDDFEIFAGSFGTRVNRAPVFTATPPVTRSIAENTPAGRPIGDPVSARDADGNTLAYSLRGADADSFAVDAGAGQIKTQGTYDFEQKSSYSVIIRVSDGEGGRANVVVGIAVTDVDEPPATVPSSVIVTPGDSALTVRWDAVPDEAGKPPVSGYEVAHRTGDSGEWQEGQTLSSRVDTSITLTGLANEQAYQVRVRTLNEEGASAWSAPVSGTPVGGPVPVGVIPAQILALSEGDTAVVNVVSAFTHPGRLSLTYTAASSDDAVAVVSVSDSVVTIRPVAVGRATVTVTASDGRWSATQEVAVTVLLTAPGICGRTPQVREALLSLVPEVTDCALVTEAHLSAIVDTLSLRKQGITALKAGDFAGLSSLRVLRLGSNSLTALPRGVFSGLDSLQELQLGANALSRLPGDVFSGLSSLQRLDLGGNALTALPEGVFSGLSDLQTLLLYVNRLDTLPEGVFFGLDSLQSLWLDQNPGAPFPLMLTLKRTDNPDVFAPGPATVRATLAEGAPFTMRVGLSITGGSLSHSEATIEAGSTTSTPITVTQDADNPTIVSLESVSGAPEGYRGIRTGVGGPLRLFVKPIEVVGSVDTQTLDPDGGEETVDVSGLFRGETTLKYEVSSSKPNVASVSISGSVVKITSSSPGRTTITITAIDAQDNRVETTFRVVVTSPPRGGGGGGGGGGTSPPSPPRPPPPPGPNQAPTFDDGSSTSRTVPENTASGRNIQHPVRATDPDRNSLTYSLSGDDADSFAIHTGGQLRTRSGQTYDYETKDRYEVTVEADDRYGGTATIDVTIHVADVDEPPETPARPQVQPASSTSLTVTWTAPVNTGPDITDYDVQYRTGSGSFLPWPHSDTGTTTTITNLEVNKRYEVQVRAHNDEGESPWSPSGFGTTSANLPPVFDETAPTRSLIENTTGVQDVGNPVTATDPEGTSVTYRLSRGDTESFDIDENTGQLQTATGVAYDFETKDRYSVTVEAQDEQGGRATITVTVNVTDDDSEEPETPDKPTVTAQTLNSLSIRWTAPANTGPAINDYDVQYREGTTGPFSPWTHDGPGTSTTITSLTANTDYQVQVLARSPEGESDWSESVDARTSANRAPTFNEGTSATRSFAENTTGTNDVGSPVTARDHDGGTPEYSLSGADAASFTIGADDGQLQTVSGTTYDYEEKARYVVTVRVEDGQGGSNTIEVTINLTDQQEKPGTPAAPSVSAASSTSLTVTWDEPTNTGPDIDRYNVQYREGDSGAFTSWTHNSADRTTTITDLTPDTTYQAQVQARSAEGTSDWSESGTGSTDANGLPVFTDGSSATRFLAENTTGVQNIGDPVGATDPENTTPTYSLAGTDADSFSIDTRSGQLRTRSGKTFDYEATPSFSVDVKATDGHGGDRTIPVSIDLTDLNEVPVFTSETTLEAPENSSFAGSVTAQDLDQDDSITDYTITGGADRDLLEITSGGVLTFKDDPDFENPTDAGRNNGYVVVVTATGGSAGRALTAQQTITVNVTDENEPPHFTSDDSFYVKENEQVVARVAAQDVDRDDQVTGYEVTGGADGDEFEIANTRELRFKDDPDFERPADAGSDNEYIVEVEATGGADTRELTTTQSITVTVEDKDEPPGKPDPPAVSNETESSLTVTWDAPTNTGPDITNYFLQYRDSGSFTTSPDSSLTRTRSVAGLRSGRTYQFQVQAKNDEGKGPWSNTGSGRTLTAPTVSSVAFTSSPASGQNSTYKLNDVIDVTATFNDTVAVTDTPQIDLTIGSNVRKADYESGSATTQLLFQYTVAGDDEDTNGATINEKGLKLNGGSIRKNNTAINADLAHTARANQSGHKVDGKVPTPTKAEVDGDKLTLTYGEALVSNPKPATSDFEVTVDSETRNVTAVAVSNTKVTLTLASAVNTGETVALAYTPGTNPIRDRARNPAGALSNLAVTNLRNVCNRTAQVRDEIMDEAGVSACGDVTADHLAAITRLNLIDENISTLKAGDFAGLTSLEKLYLSDNNISTLPANIFSDLSALEELYLKQNNLSNLGANTFSGLTALTSLDLSFSRLGNFDANLFSGLTSLTHLNLLSARVNSLPANGFSALTALDTLILQYNLLGDLAADEFSGLSSLEYLELKNTRITSLPADVFSNLSGLKHLDMEYARLTSFPATVFSGLSSLEHLNLSRNETGSLDAGLFSGLTELIHLDLASMGLTSVPANLFSGLTELESLDLSYNNDLTELPDGIFSALTKLRTLHLRTNDVSTLDGLLSGLTELRSLDLRQMDLSALGDSVFSGLTKLTRLQLQWNPVDPLPITVSLESTGTDQLAARAHTGAPFDMVLPLRLANGEIDSGEGSITIPQGSVQSGALSVSRTAGTRAAVTVDLGTLPGLPTSDNGYELVRSGDLPLVVIDAEAGVEIYPTELTLPEDDSDTYTVVLTMQPTADVTVTVTVPSGADVTVNPSPLTFTTDNWDTPKTVTVSTSADTDSDDDEVTLTHAVSGGYQGVTADDVEVTVTETAVTTNSPPSIFHNSRTVDENFTGHISIVGTDPDDRDYITGYELTGGRDRALFEITTRAGRGELSFVDVPDFERPAGTSNRNEIVVTVTSGMGTRQRTGQQQIAINVRDVDEPPGRPPAPGLSLHSGFTPAIDVSMGGRIGPVNTGPDITAWGVQYREKDSGDDFTSTTHTSATLDARIENLTKGLTYEVQVQAKNDEGDSEWSPSAEIEISNQPPVAVGTFDDLTLAVGGAVEIVSANGVFSSQDGDLLTYTASSGNTGAASVQMIGTEVLVDPGSAGSATITVTASDPYGASDSESFDVTVQAPTLSAPTLTVTGNLFTLSFTDDFAADETRAYHVRIRQKTNHGPWATGCHTETNDEDSQQSISVSLEDAVSDFFEPGTTYEADYGYLGASCDGSLAGSRSATAEETTSGTASFDIDLVFVGSISSTYRTHVENAAERWEEIITDDIPNQHLSSRNREYLNGLFPGTTAPEVVDDIVIYVRSADVVGIAAATSRLHRSPSSLPFASEIQLGTRFVINYLTALHEMGHALGFGTYPWTNLDLLKDPSRGPFGTLISPSPDTYFSGAKAIAAFNTAGGSSYTGARVPVENSSLNAASRDSHWRQSVLQSELMTPGSSNPAPLSAITIQAMADLGYIVDVTQADAYTLPSSSKIAIGPEGQIPLDCVIEHPEAGLEKPEPIILNLRRVAEDE